MDMNYLVQRKINAKKAYRRKVIATIALSAILLVLIIVGLVKVIMDEKKAEENAANKGSNVSENITPGLGGEDSGSTGESNTEASGEEVTPAPTEPPATATPTPTPVPKKKVAVDAGHGGNKDFGSSRPNENQYEKHANLAIALFLKEELLQRGYDVYMIREGDDAVENKDRPILAKENGADIYVSIHLNSLDEDSDATRGAETLYSNLRNKESSVLAQYVIDELTKVIGTRNRGIKERDGLVVLNSNELPACLVECGFMSSATERANLFNAEYQKKIAEGIANGIEKYLPLE